MQLKTVICKSRIKKTKKHTNKTMYPLNVPLSLLL